MKVGIVGLGYVGLPLACLCARRGHEVVGLDIKEEIIKKINNGVSPIKDSVLNKDLAELKGKIKATSDSAIISECEVVVVCVPTPVDDKHLPDLTAVKEATASIFKNLKPGQLIIIESTIHPGTTEEIVQPILEKSGLKAGKDFYLAHCPERIDPGNKRWNIENLPRVVAGTNPESTKKASEFYHSILNSEVLELNSVKAAEATKIMENAFRDVNIAFVNEMAKSFDRAGIDISEVIRAASTKPFSFLPHYPGCGVGGHCISIDPYYLIEKAKTYGFDHQFLSLARKINNSMPDYTIELLINELNKIGKSIKGARIGLLGVAYKPNIDDTRESPALKIIKLLKERGAELFVFDPYIPQHSNVASLNELLQRADYLILATAHKEFVNIEEELKNNNISLVIDGRNCLDKEKLLSYGILYKGIGH